MDQNSESHYIRKRGLFGESLFGVIPLEDNETRARITVSCFLKLDVVLRGEVRARVIRHPEVRANKKLGR